MFEKRHRSNQNTTGNHISLKVPFSVCFSKHVLKFEFLTSLKKVRSTNFWKITQKIIDFSTHLAPRVTGGGLILLQGGIIGVIQTDYETPRLSHNYERDGVSHKIC